ncbi:MAG: tripartite tricarboxylate transporter substrate binding protein [Rhodospirillales bacterium]|nr:tripartite tricarboxylate transporter substrate binding protein [Rhodospirillales bacterium]
MVTRRDIGKLFAGALLAATLALPALAAEDTLPASMDKPGGFPERPLNMIVPYGPGGGSGQVSRAMVQAFTELTGVGVNPDYKPGGSGIVGLGNYMAAPADGYTVLEHIDDATSAYVSGSSGVNPASDLVPLVISQITFSQIYIRSSEDRFSDWATFVAWAKAQDGKATIANVSREGSMERINLKMVMDHFGFDMQQISFDKGGPRYGALKGGQVDALFEQPGDVRGFLDSGDFKPILTLLKERPAAFAEVPAMGDVGLTFEPLMRFRGFYVKKGVPEDRLEWLQWAFQKAYFQPSYQAYNKSKFMDLIDSFRDTAGAVELINQTAEGYKAVYKEMGLIK